MKTITTLIARTAIAATVAIAFAGAAQANVVLTSATSQGMLTKANFGKSGAVTVPVWNINDNGNSLLAFCIEPTVAGHANDAGYVYSGASFSGFADNTSVQRLYSLYYSNLDVTTDAGKVNALGFQVALWELFNDNGDLTTGNLIALSAGNLAKAKPVISTATDMIAAAKGTAAITTHYDFTRFAATNSQSVVTATAISAVPEPSSFAMFGLGLAAMGFIARRRRG